MYKVSNLIWSREKLPDNLAQPSPNHEQSQAKQNRAKQAKLNKAKPSQTEVSQAKLNKAKLSLFLGVD